MFARNREIAGVHYRSDSEAGGTLAQELDTHLWTNLYLSTGSTVFQETIDAAKGEWT